MEYFDDVTTAFYAFCHSRYNAIEDWMEVLERFVVLLYDRVTGGRGRTQEDGS